MTPGDAYCNSLLVRVVGPNFVAGLLVDPVTERVVFAAPILRHLTGQHRDKLRQGFTRLGWRATIVKRGAPSANRAYRTRQKSERRAPEYTPFCLPRLSRRCHNCQ